MPIHCSALRCYSVPLRSVSMLCHSYALRSTAKPQLCYSLQFRCTTSPCSANPLPVASNPCFSLAVQCSSNAPLTLLCNSNAYPIVSSPSNARAIQSMAEPLPCVSTLRHSAATHISSFPLRRFDVLHHFFALRWESVPFLGLAKLCRSNASRGLSPPPRFTASLCLCLTSLFSAYALLFRSVPPLFSSMPLLCTAFRCFTSPLLISSQLIHSFSVLFRAVT